MNKPKHLNDLLSPTYLDELDKILRQIKENAFNLNEVDLKELKQFTDKKFDPVSKYNKKYYGY